MQTFQNIVSLGTGDAAWAAVTIDFINSILLALTLAFGIKATFAATAAARAAESGLEIGSRAYVNAFPVETPEVNTSGEPVARNFRIELTNTGETPALDCMLGAATIALDQNGVPYHLHAGRRFIKSLGKGEMFSATGPMIPHKLVKDAYTDKGELFMYYSLEYSDVFSGEKDRSIATVCNIKVIESFDKDVGLELKLVTITDKDLRQKVCGLAVEGISQAPITSQWAGL